MNIEYGNHCFGDYLRINGDIVTVLNTNNYISNYSESEPFEAKVIGKYDINIMVKSLDTGNRYELYSHQILGGFKSEEKEDNVNEGAGFFELLKDPPPPINWEKSGGFNKGWWDALEELAREFKEEE